MTTALPETSVCRCPDAERCGCVSAVSWVTTPKTSNGSPVASLASCTIVVRIAWPM
jgi:hypothetical protein